ncbi:MAG: NAD-dependent epimerase/dehydratase family protein [Pseudomonadota bacterium]|nr:NAD-dependent epimerase/dehydratase family protein [Pseudomonadota bacterium]
MTWEALTDKNIMITGAGGYIAANLTAALGDTSCRILRIDKPGVVFPPRTGRGPEILDMALDIRRRDAWDGIMEDVDIVYHLAAQTSVYAAESDPEADLEINVLPLLNMLTTCRRRGLRPAIILAGTVTQAGLTGTLPVNEDHPDRPITIYDYHKLAAERYLLHFTAGKSVRGTVLRLANVYGPGPKSGSADRGVLNAMIRKALGGDELTIYGEGDCQRDYVFIDDVVAALLLAAVHIDSLAGRYFVIGSGLGHTIAQAIHAVARQVELKTERSARVRNIAAPADLSPIEYRHFVADSRRFSHLTGWRPRYTLQEGIDATIRDYLSGGYR